MRSMQKIQVSVRPQRSKVAKKASAQTHLSSVRAHLWPAAEFLVPSNGMWENGSAKKDADRDGNRWVASLKYQYPLSKRTLVYALGTYARGAGMFNKAQAKATRLLTAFGVQHNF